MEDPKQKTVYQYDLAGRYVGPVEADESPLQPGVFLLPARTTETEPPERDTWPEGTWPRWTGSDWALTGLNKGNTPAPDALAKLQMFLAANPDVAAAIGVSDN